MTQPCDANRQQLGAFSSGGACTTINSSPGPRPRSRWQARYPPQLSAGKDTTTREVSGHQLLGARCHRRRRAHRHPPHGPLLISQSSSLDASVSGEPDIRAATDQRAGNNPGSIVAGARPTRLRLGSHPSIQPDVHACTRRIGHGDLVSKLAANVRVPAEKIQQRLILVIGTLRRTQQTQRKLAPQGQPPQHDL